MRDVLLDSPLIHMDETVVQVLKEPGKAATSNSYMWVQTGGPADKPVVLFDYDGYNAVARTPGVDRLACWAHVRRRFVEAARVQPKGRRGKADEAVSLIGKLYRIEREHQDSSAQTRLLARQSASAAILAELHAWMLQHMPQVAPKSALGTALTYMANLWPQLTRYTERADLLIDNNRCENAIRPFVLGRKAWMFSDTPAGAHASAVIYSLVETAKGQGQWAGALHLAAPGFAGFAQSAERRSHRGAGVRGALTNYQQPRRTRAKASTRQTHSQPPATGHRPAPPPRAAAGATVTSERSPSSRWPPPPPGAAARPARPAAAGTPGQIYRQQPDEDLKPEPTSHPDKP